jgi:hypothetical protein
VLGIWMLDEEVRHIEIKTGKHFDMNLLIDWCQVSSISALFLMELLLQAVNSCMKTFMFNSGTNSVVA